jgi:hypothetical protein
MDAEKLKEEVSKLQAVHGQHINVLVNHEEILIVAYNGAIPKEDQPEYLNIKSEGG